MIANTKVNVKDIIKNKWKTSLKSSKKLAQES